MFGFFLDWLSPRSGVVSPGFRCSKFETITINWIYFKLPLSTFATISTTRARDWSVARCTFFASRTIHKSTSFCNHTFNNSQSLQIFVIGHHDSSKLIHSHSPYTFQVDAAKFLVGSRQSWVARRVCKAVCWYKKTSCRIEVCSEENTFIENKKH